MIWFQHPSLDRWEVPSESPIQRTFGTFGGRSGIEPEPHPSRHLSRRRLSQSQKFKKSISLIPKHLPYQTALQRRSLIVP